MTLNLALTLTSDDLESYIFIFTTIKNPQNYTWFNFLGSLEAETEDDSNLKLRLQFQTPIAPATTPLLKVSMLLGYY